jgi:hypothetical protein
MQENIKNRRSDSFKWHTKQELCEYFQIHYGFTKKLIDSEIEQAIKAFKLRKDQPIKTKELWQKVGNAIERKIKELEQSSEK